jgi:hypothetical protein
MAYGVVNQFRADPTPTHMRGCGHASQLPRISPQWEPWTGGRLEPHRGDHLAGAVDGAQVHGGRILVAGQAHFGNALMRTQDALPQRKRRRRGHRPDECPCPRHAVEPTPSGHAGPVWPAGSR